MAQGVWEAALAGCYQSPLLDTRPNPLCRDLLGLMVLVPVTQHMSG